MTDTATDLPKLLTDAPAKAKEDLLGFQPHADRLAALILRQIPDKASFVIGIEGEWGEGKSSFINLLKAAFPTEETDKARPTIVDFNPWWFEGSDQLLRHFFDELLGQIDWTRGDGQKLFDSFSKLAAFAGRVGKLMQLAPEPMLQTAGKVAEGVGQAFGSGSKPESFRKLREDAAATLSALSFKTIVFIDDLDRLPAREIVELFRVIKAVADLPNIVYVIAYDRAIVASALNEVHKNRGEEYLEKIIQYPYALPRPHVSVLLKYNENVLTSYLSGLSFATEESGAVKVVKAFVRLPRNSKRLCGALLEYNNFGKSDMEMDALDYLFVQAVRCFDATMYRELVVALKLSGQYCSLSPDRGQIREGILTERVTWVRERFSETMKNYGGNEDVLECLHYFTGFAFSNEQDDLSQLTYRHDGQRLLAHAVSNEKNHSARRLLEAYLAKQRDQVETSALELEAFSKFGTAEEINDYLASASDKRTRLLLNDLKLNWHDLFKFRLSKFHVLAWAELLQKAIGDDSNLNFAYDIDELLKFFVKVLAKDYRSEAGGLGANPGLVIDCLLNNDLDDLVFRLTFCDDYLVGFPDIKRGVIERLLAEKSLRRVLGGGYFGGACQDAHSLGGDLFDDWFDDLILDDEMSAYQREQLLAFVGSSFVEKGNVNSGRQNRGIRHALEKVSQTVQARSTDSRLQAGYQQLMKSA